MNTKRKAELQRRLSMASVPRPPADLASRIKHDIPASIGGARPAWYRTPALSIAASLVVVIACALLAIRTLSRAPESRMTDALSMGKKAASELATPRSQTIAGAQPAAANEPAAPATVAPPAPARTRAAETSPAPAFAPERAPQTTDEVASAAPQEQPARTAALPPPPPPPPPSAPEAQNVASGEAAAPHAAVATRVAQAAPKPHPEFITVTGAAPPVVTASTRERALKAESGHETLPTEGGVVVGGVAGGLASEQRQTDAKMTARDTVIAVPRYGVTHAIAPSMFGISTDPEAMEIVRAAVKGGQEPADVNIEAIVNYFASKADEPPRTMTLQIEGSPPPVLATPRTRIVRITIDTPRSDSNDSSVAATDAFLSISFDPAAVVAHRLIGGTAQLTPSQRIVLKNTSVTALYEIQLRSGVRPRQKVVMARLTYRDGASGKLIGLPQMLQVRDIDRAWLDASYRHRLATLGAIWGESLKNARGDGEVARRAAELAQQDPQDHKAKELAELASASSRRRSSGSTGSGR